MRNLGLDIGEKRIGVAISDSEEILASPLETIAYKEETQAIKSIIALIKRYDIGRVVVGLPYSLNGEEGPQAHKVREFIEKLTENIDVEVCFQDERLTTVTAGNMLLEAGVKKNKRKEKLDAAAAAIILQAFLDGARYYGQ